MSEITHKRQCHDSINVENWEERQRQVSQICDSINVVSANFFFSQTAHVHWSHSLLSSSRYKYKHFLTVFLSHIKDTSSLSVTAQSLASLCSFVLWKWLLGFRFCLHYSCSSLALPQLLLTWKVMLAKYSFLCLMFWPHLTGLDKEDLA
jgi:hypothetical protein